MELILAIVVGGLYAGGVYMLMRRSILKLIIGLGLLGNASNLLIFAMGNFNSNAPLIQQGETAMRAPYADPLPQALILTAIVIGFGTLAFTIILTRRVYKTSKTDDLDALVTTER